MILSQKVSQKIHQCVDTVIYPKAEKRGQYFYKAFGSKGASQANNFKTLAYSTNRFIDILNFVKNQVGKESKMDKGWLYKEQGNELPLGIQILKDLEEIRDKYAKEMAKELENSEESLDQKTIEIALQLARSYIDSLVIEYLYRNKLNV